MRRQVALLALLLVAGSALAEDWMVRSWVAYRKPQGKAAPAIEALLGEIAGEAGR